VDPLGIAVIAAPFVAKGAEAFSNTAGEKLGGLVGDLCRSVVDRFKGDAGAQQVLASAQEKPDSKTKQVALQAAIAEKMEDDANFAQEIQRLVDAVKGECAGYVLNQQKQTVNGPQKNIVGDVQEKMVSGQVNGAIAMEGSPLKIDRVDRLEIHHHDEASSRPVILNASEYISIISTLKEWKEMHTKAHEILDKLSPAVDQLDRCQYDSNSSLDAVIKSVDLQWKYSSRSLKTSIHVIKGFHHIASDDNVKCCLDHAITCTKINDLISRAKTLQDAEYINICLGKIIEDFEIALLVADGEIVKLVDNFASEFPKRR